MLQKSTYYKYKGYKGERYFRMSEDGTKCVQICVSSGEIKKGRGNCIGIYLLERITIVGNYAFYAGFEPCTKAVYEKAYKKVLQMLLNVKI